MGAMIGDISNTVPSLGQAAAGGVDADPQQPPMPLQGGKWGGAMQPGPTPITGNPTPGQTAVTGPGQPPAIQYQQPPSNSYGQPTPIPGVGGKAGAPGFGQPNIQPVTGGPDPMPPGMMPPGMMPPGMGQPGIQPVPNMGLPNPNPAGGGQLPDFARQIIRPPARGFPLPQPGRPGMRPPAQRNPLQPVKFPMPQPGGGNGMSTVGMTPRNTLPDPRTRGFGRSMGPNGQIIT